MKNKVSVWMLPKTSPYFTISIFETLVSEYWFALVFTIFALADGRSAMAVSNSAMADDPQNGRAPIPPWRFCIPPWPAVDSPWRFLIPPWRMTVDMGGFQFRQGEQVRRRAILDGRTFILARSIAPLLFFMHPSDHESIILTLKKDIKLNYKKNECNLGTTR